MGSRKLIIALSLCALITLPAFPAETDEVEIGEGAVDASLSMDLVSAYIWRGQDLGGVSIQPGASVGYRGLSFGLWGSSGFERNDTKEFDLCLEYSTGGFSVGVTDYWFDNGPGYFHYAAHRTAHVFEGHLGYYFGPLALNWYTNFAGNDGVTRKGKRAYSSYVELSAPFTLGGLDWSAEVGASPWATSFYNASGFSVIDLGLGVGKQFTVADSFGLTVSVKGIWNPRDDKGYLTAGISFAKL